jgi:hypothetical protein
MRKFYVVPITVFVLALAILVLPQAGFAGGAPRVTLLVGSEEVPLPGDPDGIGFASIWLNHGQSTVCWELAWTGIGTPFGAHIHEAPAGVAGGVVIPLSPIAAGCKTEVDRDLIKDIIQNPEGFYVNVHTPPFPAGAIRGQLSNRGLSNE